MAVGSMSTEADVATEVEVEAAEVEAVGSSYYEC